MAWFELLYRLLCVVTSVIYVYADSFSIMENGGDMPAMHQVALASLMKKQRLQHPQPGLHPPQQRMFPNLILPPFNSGKFVTMPQLPIGMVGFPSNMTFMGPSRAPVRKGFQNFPGLDNKYSYLRYISIPPGSPLTFLRNNKWNKKGQGSPNALGVAIQGPVLPVGTPGPQADPVHHLPMNHLFVPVPVSPGPGAGAKQEGAPPPAVADILIVIDATPAMGTIEPRGLVVWNPAVVEFLNSFIQATPMGPAANRIGVVVVSKSIDDLIPITPDKKYLVNSLNMLRPSFEGGCTEKGISTASSLFYQYGRPNAVKRIVLLSDSTLKCPYGSMAEMANARKCGIDIIHVGFGPGPKPSLPVDKWEMTYFGVPGIKKLPTLGVPVAERAFIAPIHGMWSPWSEWNMCSSAGDCSVGYQMRFRLCDNPRPKYGGQACKGFAAETRMCFHKPCIDVHLGHWTRWSEYTPCSSMCGKGFQTRKRTCLTMDGQPSAACKGPYVERIDCHNTHCPVNGGWSPWSELGQCSVKCGAGVQVRARICDNPPPSYGGHQCKGLAIEEVMCDTGIPCPIHGGFGPWVIVGGCDGACGMGMMKKIRACDNPLPQFGGNECVGDIILLEPCDTGIPCPVDGLWGPWSEYLPCSVKCGVGIKQRKRFCDSPVPSFGGIPCVGHEVEEMPCDSGVPCPINGGWSIWSEFKPCSAACGLGITQRVRVCNNPVPLFGGSPCLGIPVEERECDTGIPCAINGGWGPWTDFGVCSVECGIGIATRTRVCDSPVPSQGGAMCVGLAVDQRECDTGIKCPVDGYWSFWLPWSQCSAACGLGVRQRNRLCNNPIPDFGGLSCEGTPFQEEPCDTGVPCPVNGGWSAWSEPSICSAPCGMGTAKRVRTCTNPVPLYGGLECFGPDFEIFECDTGIPCPIHGGWSFWAAWSVCKADCGVSVQHRERVCDTPMPAFGGMPCEGLAIEERPCDTGVACPIPGDWSVWLEWGVCSVDCGVGITMRKRFCDNPPPQFGGPPCLGTDIEERPCDTGVPCPVNGGWSMWGELTPCSVSCGVGFMRRTRVCNNPVPSFGGLLCIGPDFEELPCDTKVSCPVHGSWGMWSEFSLCSAACGVGRMQRVRECNAPVPMFDGLPCKGPDVEERPCDTGVMCAIHGGWTLWSAFTPCDAQCGAGVMRRLRECSNPAPLYGGRPCDGFAVEEKVCNTGVSCRINGNWSPWSIVTDCSVSCGVGIQTRSRLCNNPHPQFGGSFCIGLPLEQRDCDTRMNCPINGGWSVWSQYGACSAKCGMGMKSRVRECINPVPMYGGDLCKGPNIEEIPCDSGLFCPIDGGWTLWSSWAFCSADCGTGVSIRKRECANPLPVYGGLPCSGPAMEETACDTGIHCPVPGGWSPWSDFLPCSAVCGVGVRQRSRVCNNPLPMYGGEFCLGEETQTKPCDTGVYCPIDGGFSMWSKWSMCTGECGDGLQFRERFCNAPEPMHGGLPCKGIFREERACDTGIMCPIHGHWGEWSMFTTCSESCGTGVQERSRLCDSPIPMYGGMMCPGTDLEVKVCDTGIMCPIHGEWSIWTMWSKCSADCLDGLQFRERTCTNPPPDFGGLPCEGIALQEQVCSTGVPCPIDGGWGFWTDWLPCSAVCGVGVLKRSRQCNNPPPQFGGVPCAGPTVEETMCDTGVPCPVDGHWGLWANWGFCSVSCGVGMHARVRECVNPAPMYGGMPCVGEHEQIQPCDTGIVCPVHGFWSLWSTWTPCSQPCGVGFQGRTRTCTNPPPSDGGLFCDGPAAEKIPCDTGILCPIQGNWGPWSDFSKCDATCGMGTQVRARVCDNPPPQYGGLPCEGPDLESIPCDAGSMCAIHGGWSLWSEFGLCVGICGVGSQERTRTCSAPVPQYGGLPCKGPSADIMECDTGIPCSVNGGWSLWYEWSACVADCGMGMRERRRECNNPPPLHGGLLCENTDAEISPCDTGVPCPIHGGWSLWSLPTACSGACGYGIQTRARTCTDPLPAFGGHPCKGPAEDVIDCDTGVPCPVDGQWSIWGTFGPCNVQCGVGMHVRERICDNPPPAYGGFPCDGPNLHEEKCDTGIPCKPQGWSFWSPWSGCQAVCGVGEQVRVRECPLPPAERVLLCPGPDTESRPCDTSIPCPIHGGWTFWTVWGVCSAGCGAGIHARYRECTNPLPAFGGHPCPGPAMEEKECLAEVPCPINGGWTLWSLWTLCNVDCGVGLRSRERLCENPPTQYGGLPCPGPNVETEECSSGVSCPIPGAWSPWGFWSECSAICGVGKQVRGRLCNAPSPQFGGPECPGPMEEWRPCDTGIVCPIDGFWGMWGEWSLCVNCGVGEQRRTRLCDSPMPENGGLPCKGFAEEFRPCDSGIPCPIDGQWGLWSVFGHCSVSCGMGIHVRTRLCDNPPPQFGGLPCVGIQEEPIGCDSGVACPVHGEWGPWYGWSACFGTCGIGQQERRRDCDNPKPMYGGLSCQGSDVETGPCDTLVPCSQDGNWGLWTSFMPCSAKCGVGLQERFRECNNPPPVGDGLFCPGPAKEAIECDSGIPCRIDGGWSLWGLWGLCVGKCGMGIQSRERTCSNPTPAFGGAMCKGLPIEERMCDTLIPCVIPPGWTEWSAWGICTASCATGVTTRFRECTSPKPGHGPLMCEGPSTETMNCDSGVPCMIDGNWGSWYEWSACLGDCGIGMRERRRECNDPPPKYGGMPCIGPVMDVQDCDVGAACPVHGGWSLWGQWSMCGAMCGLGAQRRARVCDNPPPAFGGVPCPGPIEETRECDSGRMCPIDGYWSVWSEWTMCSAACGFGEQKRVRTCTPPQYGGLDCQGLAFEVVKCDAAVPCPIDGGWSMWSDWSLCGGTCGISTSERIRKCTSPIPQYGGMPCIGPEYEVIDCDTQIPCPVDGHWSLWSKWGQCTAGCGIGEQIRYRTCDEPRPAYGGMMCAGLPEEVMVCDTGLPCPVHGGWSIWSHWGTCEGCNIGFQTRFRTCSEPKPMFGGDLCFGVPEEQQKCDTGVPCPIHGHWSAWSLWGKCDVMCGDGMQVRMRTCSNPRPQFGGSMCFGLPEETQPCTSGVMCPVDGHWGPWLAWGQCSAMCGMGMRKRIRLCDSPIPANGGLSCAGPDMYEEPCDTGIPCIVAPQWSEWGLWTACSAACDMGVQTRERFCDSPPPGSPDVGCTGPHVDTRPCDTGLPCVVHGGWTEWTPFGNCIADCSQGPAYAVGYTSRQRFCTNPAPGPGGLPCEGPALERIPCNEYPPCFVAEWSQWTGWSRCSAPCGPGQQERTRYCVHAGATAPIDACLGPTIEVVPCEIMVCPEYPLNCSAECKWDNGIGYATYPGDCSKFVQCESLDGVPRVHDCSWGLLWSLDLLQCVFPAQSECNVCEGSNGSPRPYHISCKAYWDCTSGIGAARCCGDNERFNPFSKQCEPDVKGLCTMPCNVNIPPPPPDVNNACHFRASPTGAGFYEENISGEWITRPCSIGTIFSEATCQCIYFTDGFSNTPKECLPELHLTFDTLKEDLARNPGLHIEHVRYLGDGTAYFNGSAAINDNNFANIEWGNDVFVYIRFKPEGTSQMQGLVHNSGCGPSDIGPSVFIGLDRDRTKYSNDNLNLMFAAVPTKKQVEYNFVNVSTPADQVVDAWFRYSTGLFQAEVNGQTVMLDMPKEYGIARRHGALNIGGNLCKIGDVAFGGLVGYFDEVRVYKCKPPGHFDTVIAPAPAVALPKPFRPERPNLPTHLLQGPTGHVPKGRK